MKQIGPVKVLFVNDHLGAPDGGIHGVTRYLTTVLSHFDRNDVLPSLCVLRGRHPEVAVLERMQIPTVFFDRGKWDPFALRDLNRVVREWNPEILHLSGMKGILLGRLAARITGRRAIVHLHDTIPPDPITRCLQRGLVQWTHKVIAISTPVRAAGARHLGIPVERIEVIPNGVDLNTFGRPSSEARSRIRAELALPDDAPVVGVIGRVVEVKGQHVLLTGLPRLLQLLPRAVVLVVGDGPARSRCEKIVEGSGLQHAVRFTGYRNDIPGVLAAVDIVAMPSLWEEGFGLAALEAIAGGKPVVAFDVGALSVTVVDGGTGLLVPKGDEAALADALARILKDPELYARLSRGGRRHARTFSVEGHVARLVGVYRGLLGTPERLERPSTVT